MAVGKRPVRGTVNPVDRAQCLAGCPRRRAAAAPFIALACEVALARDRARAATAHANTVSRVSRSTGTRPSSMPPTSGSTRRSKARRYSTTVRGLNCSLSSARCNHDGT